MTCTPRNGRTGVRHSPQHVRESAKHRNPKYRIASGRRALGHDQKEDPMQDSAQVRQVLAALVLLISTLSVANAVAVRGEPAGRGGHGTVDVRALECPTAD